MLLAKKHHKNHPKSTMTRAIHQRRPKVPVVMVYNDCHCIWQVQRLIFLHLFTALFHKDCSNCWGSMHSSFMWFQNTVKLHIFWWWGWWRWKQRQRQNDDDDEDNDDDVAAAAATADDDDDDNDDDHSNDDNVSHMIFIKRPPEAPFSQRTRQFWNIKHRQKIWCLYSCSA